MSELVFVVILGVNWSLSWS